MKFRASTLIIALQLSLAATELIASAPAGALPAPAAPARLIASARSVNPSIAIKKISKTYHSFYAKNTRREEFLGQIKFQIIHTSFQDPAIPDKYSGMITNLHVDAEFRSLGIGSSLFSKAIQRIASFGVKETTWRSFSPQDDSVPEKRHKFYMKLGGRPCKELTNLEQRNVQFYFDHTDEESNSKLMPNSTKGITFIDDLTANYLTFCSIPSEQRKGYFLGKITITHPLKEDVVLCDILYTQDDTTGRSVLVSVRVFQPDSIYQISRLIADEFVLDISVVRSKLT